MFQGRMYVPAVIGGVKTTINSFLKGITPPPTPEKKFTVFTPILPIKLFKESLYEGGARSLCVPSSIILIRL